MEKFSYLKNYNKSRKKIFKWFRNQILSKSIINKEEKIKQNLITYTLLDEISGKINQIKTEYDFEKNCWIIKKEITLTTAFRIANELKRKYYKNKTWVISWNNKNLKINFVDKG